MTTFVELEKQYLELSPKPYAVPLGALGPILEKCTLAMSKRDWLVTGPRGKAAALLRGCSAERLVSVTDGVANYKIAPCSFSPANRALHAVGLALSSKRPVLCLLGIASAANGSYYEALNVASLYKLPILFVLVQQNLENIPMSPQISGSPVKLAQSLGLETETASSKDSNLQHKIATLREAKKPTLIVINLEK